MSTREDLLQRWASDARLGVTQSMNHPEHRRVVLANQMAILGGGLTLFYGLLALIYSPTLFWPLLAATPPLLAAYASVLWLDSQHRFLAARLVLMVLPATHITFTVWLFGNQAGIQLHFFVLWTVLFLMHSREERWLSIAAVLLWASLYAWLQMCFNTPVLDLQPSDGVLGLSITELVFITSSFTSFALVGATITLFYIEIQRTETLLQSEYRRTEELLKNILPGPVAERLKNGDTMLADSASEVTLLFADLVGFTRLAGKLPPTEVVSLLDRIFTEFDRIVERYALEKIKTIGDEYMLAGGLPRRRLDHAQAVAEAALDMLASIKEMDRHSRHRLEVRIGIHTGEVVAGVIGSRKFSYDVWGDTVNTASRMQTEGVTGRIQITEATAQRLQSQFTLKPRGKIRIPGKGRMRTWFLTGRAPG